MAPVPVRQECAAAPRRNPMPSPARSAVPLALSLSALLALTGCASLFGPDLEELLLPRNAFSGYTVHSVDADEVRQGPSSRSEERRVGTGGGPRPARAWATLRSSSVS